MYLLRVPSRNVKGFSFDSRRQMKALTSPRALLVSKKRGRKDHAHVNRATPPLIEEKMPGSGLDDQHDTPPPWKLVLAMCTAAIFICYADRSNLSVALLEMDQELHYGEQLKGTILSVFFLGYACSQLVGGSLADRYGGKFVLGAGVVAWSFFTFITPDAALNGTEALIACRIAMGVGEGVAFPAVHTIIATAIPLGFQSTAVAVVTAASYGGAAAAAGLAPWIIHEYSWPMVFYVFGASALLWLPVWLVLPVPSSRPQAQQLPSADDARPRMSNALPDPQGASTTAAADGAASPRASEADPMLPRAAASKAATAEPPVVGALGLGPGFWALTRKREVWAICVAQYCQSWGMYSLLNWLPTYFSEVQHVDISDLGQYTLVPPLAQAVVGAFSGVLADRLIVNGWSVKGTRRVLQVSGMLGPAGCLLLAVSPLTDGSPTTAAALVTASQGLSALTLGAVSVSQLDIAPKHAGSIFGLGNTFATVAGLLSVQLTGSILQATGSWPLVFAFISAHYVVGAAVWFAWVGGELLPEDELV